MSLRNKMLAVIDDVNGSVAEREELVEMIAIALLTRKNLFVLGDPGQAKSYAINLFRQHITGTRQFERLLSKQSDEEQLFGRVDLSSLIPGSIPDSALEGDDVYQNLRFDLKCAVDGLGQMKNAPETFVTLDKAADKLEAYRKAVALLRRNEPTVQTAGKIPEADIVLLDEIFKCNDGVLNSLLTALNERKYTNEGRTASTMTFAVTMLLWTRSSRTPEKSSDRFPRCRRISFNPFTLWHRGAARNGRSLCLRGSSTRRFLSTSPSARNTPRSRRCARGGSFRLMRLRLSLPQGPLTSWMTFSRSWAESKAHSIRWKSWSRRRKLRQIG